MIKARNIIAEPPCELPYLLWAHLQSLEIEPELRMYLCRNTSAFNGFFYQLVDAYDINIHGLSLQMCIQCSGSTAKIAGFHGALLDLKSVIASLKWIDIHTKYGIGKRPILTAEWAINFSNPNAIEQFDQLITKMTGPPLSFKSGDEVGRERERGGGVTTFALIEEIK